MVSIQKIQIIHIHTHKQRRNQQGNRRHIKITYFLMAPEPKRGTCALRRGKLKTSNTQKLVLHDCELIYQFN